MDNYLIVLSGVGLFIITGMCLLLSRRYLLAFFYLCYSLPFFPLILVILGQDAEFWTGVAFSFSPDSLEVHALSLIWLLSSIAIFFSLHIYGRPTKGVHRKKVIKNDCDFSALNIRSESNLGLMIFLICAILVFCRLFYLEIIEGAFPGFDPLICLWIVLCWAIIIASPNKFLFSIILILTVIYIYSQITTGDRDFFTFLIALMLFWMTRNRLSFLSLIKIGMSALAVVMIGTYISMVRMDVQVSAEQLVLFLRFNSWNAIILPVILMIESEWTSGPLLLGKTYFDLMLSVFPSPIFSIFNIVKPITVDNPANWFYVEGLGGMHASGIALRNFGIFGVFAQAFIFSCGLLAVENIILEKTSTLRILIFLGVAASVMHTVWYGLIYMINTIVFIFTISVIISVFKHLNKQSK